MLLEVGGVRERIDTMNRRAVILFVTLGVAWGIPYAFIKLALEDLSPEMLVLARTALAAVVLLPIAIVRGELAGIMRYWKPLLAYTLVEIVFPWYCINAAEERVSSSTVALLLATIPIVGVGVAILFRRAERLTWHNYLGMLIGVTGVAALVGLDAGRSDATGLLLLSVAIVGYAIGPAILAKWLADAPSLAVVALSFVITSALYVPVVAVTGTFPTAWPTPTTLLSLAILAVVCSGVAFLVMFALVAEIGPVRMTAITYVNTAVAVALGAVMLGEHVTPVTVVGFALVVGGSYLVTRRKSAEPPVDGVTEPASARVPEDAGVDPA